MTDSNELKIKMPTLYEKQHQAIYAPERYSIIEASTKSGKTFGCLVWQAEKVIMDKRKMHHWWVAPVYPQAAIAYERAKIMFDKRLYHKNDSEMRLIFFNGAIWQFKSGEKPDNLYGEDVADAVIDEASRMREESWHAIRSTITKTKGPVRIIGNVKGRKNWAYKLARKAEAGEPNMCFHKLTAIDATDAHVLDTDEIADAKRLLPESVFKELYMAIPSDDGGNPFGLKAIRDICKPTQAGPSVVYGIDLAKSVDYTVVCGLDADWNVSECERWQSDWRRTKERIKSIVKDVPTLVDSTGVGDPVLEDLQIDGPNYEGFKYSSHTKQQLMEGLATAIQQGRTSIDPELYPILVDELESFEYEYTRTGVKYTAPQGMHDDCVNGYALAVKHKRHAIDFGFSVDVINVGKPEWETKELKEKAHVW